MRVVSVDSEGDPPTAQCVKVTKEPVEDGGETETMEYALTYVVTCVNSRKEWNKSGYGEYDVMDVYKMSMKQPKHALTCPKQSTKGEKVEL